MIKLADSTLLAFTKLRTRKVRTIVTVLLASLLFGLLISASLIINGAFKSVIEFRREGLTSRYIVNVSKAPSDPLALHRLLRDPLLITEAKKRFTQLVKDKVAEAKRLGLSYEQSSDQPPYSLGSDGTEQLSINDQNGIVHNLLKEKFSKEPAFDDAKLKKLASSYNASEVYTSANFTTLRNSSLDVPKNGKEVFYDQSDETEVNANYTRPIVDSTQMTIIPSEIANPFLLPDNAGWKPSSNNIPIILPYNVIERLLGLEQLSSKANTNEKNERMNVIREKASHITFQACYRNGKSNELIQQTIQQQKEIRANAGKKDYQKPSVIYALPNPGKCENPTITSDTRTTNEKKIDANQKLFDEEFGKEQEPKSYFVVFKIVGVSPAEENQNNPIAEQTNAQINNIDDVINNLLKTSGIGQAIPKTLYDQIPNKDQYADIFTYSPLYLFGNEDNKQRYVEFSNSKDAQRFIDEQSCTVQYDNTCKPLGRPYQASLAFSNSAALDDIHTKVVQWFNYGLLIVIIIAAIIMWITVGRTIADGRHETAIFRAIGFKRIDIAQIYILYTLILSLLVVICAIGIGFIGAYLVNEQFAPLLTAQAQYDFGVLTSSSEINLIDFDWQQLGLLLAACLSTGLLSAIIPLLRNVRRSPIRDMREE